MTAPAAPEGAAPPDAIYAVEHKRDGHWRLHIGMEVAREVSTLEVVDLPKLRKEWPDAEWRIQKYIPYSGAVAEVRELRAKLDEANTVARQWAG